MTSSASRGGNILLAVFGLTLAGSIGVSVSAQQTRTASDRVYSDAQANRGQTLYRDRCASCHGNQLQGQNAPPLTGNGFMAAWSKAPLSDLAGKIKNTMPENDPGKLTREQAVDLVAYILQSAKFPAGQAELVSSDAQLKLILMPAAPPSAAGLAVAAAGRTLTFPPAGNMAQLMRGVLFPSSNIIFNVQSHNPDDVAKTPAAGANAAGGFSWVDWGAGIYKPWELVDYAAVALAESAPLMLTPGRRCENGKPVPVDQPDWIKFTQELVDASRAAYKASQTRNQEIVSDATNDLADSCLHCHEVYRDIPGGGGADPGNKANRCSVNTRR